MGLADFFPRDAIAISQVLQGFQADVFADKLKDVHVAIAFGEEAATSRDGRELLDLVVRLVARLYPNLSVVSSPGGDQFGGCLVELAKTINPNIKARRRGGYASVALAVGTDAPFVDAPTIYAGCDGWSARVGTEGPYGTSDLGNPFGAGFAACLGAANLFRFLFLPNGSVLLDRDAVYPTDASTIPDLESAMQADPMVLVGAGAIGNGAAWALSRVPLTGDLHVVDPEAVDLSNLQRYVLCTRSDEGTAKVEVIYRAFRANGLRLSLYHGDWGSFLETHGYKWERVLVALDSVRDRRAVQGSLPRWIANAWTQTGDLGVSTHCFLGEDACLACLYLPAQEQKSEDQIVAEGLRIPQLRTQVRILLGSGLGVDRNLCGAIAAAWGIPAKALDPYVNRPIRDLWVKGVCGGGVIPLGEAGSTPMDLQVPLAFQSAFAGVILAAEAVRDVLTSGAERRTRVRRLDVLNPVCDTAPQFALKARNGLCICEDPDFISVYQEKYATTPAPSFVL